MNSNISKLSNQEADIHIKEERISAEEYIEFIKRTDLGSQYPKVRFEERIRTLVKNHIEWTEWTVQS
ncbi:hypothetical protein [Pseudobutyrivibrio xylanivorans]|uniref:Uncharacterized protein n=1 Tax=Pseudobutyrivibrio xylanivorans DSM 14809 TaxID=1123012 RepID=A0A1M6GAH0_PSEXY|nr:hypothetical protein [Pseudobutyrivibrio xylanivorans]SHJ06965.1 hypothetical protein SAMN02745725_01693 [Pseudobutyrivibrio xylanivorans DSM 14809]